MGGSQGGGLTIATAGLCGNKIAACAYFDPFPCDQREVLNIRTICRYEMNSFLKYYNNPCSLEEALHVQDLIDTRNLAGGITCPALFVTGLFDDDCPSHIGFAAYNRISSPKEYKIFPEDSHLGESDYYVAFWSFFRRQFKY
jgi:cephalosporin-C deacetylase-like acetyl esterase